MFAEADSALAVEASVPAMEAFVSLARFRLGSLGLRQSLSTSGACRASLASGHLSVPSNVSSIIFSQREIQSENILLYDLPQTADRILRDHIPSSIPPPSDKSGICSGERLRLMPRGLVLGAVADDELGCAVTTSRERRRQSKHSVMKDARMENADEPCSSWQLQHHHGSLIDL